MCVYVYDVVRYVLARYLARYLCVMKCVMKCEMKCEICLGTSQGCVSRVCLKVS